MDVRGAPSARRPPLLPPATAQAARSATRNSFQRLATGRARAHARLPGFLPTLKGMGTLALTTQITAG